MKFRSLILAYGLALTIPTVLSSGQTQKKNAPVAWIEYTDQAHGFSFRYPDNLIVIPRKVEDFGIPGLVVCLDLQEKSGPQRSVLRIMANDISLYHNDGYPMNLAELRRSCQDYKEFRIAGRLAVNCVRCLGRGGICRWEVDISGRIEYKIFSMATGIARRAPTDWIYPEVTIINSFRFSEVGTPPK